MSARNRVISIASTLATLIAIVWILNVAQMLNVAIYPEQYFAVLLALLLPVIFLGYTWRQVERGEHERLPWYDFLAALIAVVCSVYVAIIYPAIVDQVLLAPPEAWIPGTILAVLSIEATRRVAGKSLAIIVIVFLLYAIGADHVGFLDGQVQPWTRVASYMGYDTSGILGIPVAVMATIVFGFVLFGNLLMACGGSSFFTDFALRLMGRYRGGSMKIAVIASMLFGTISGSAVGNVMSTGVVTIPMNKKAGFPAYKAGAIEAVASTGGQLMPPVMGAAAFLMADYLQVSYAVVALAAFIPAVLYYYALFIQADLEAAARGIKGVPSIELPGWRTVVSGWHFTLAFAVLIYLLFNLNWLPERAALASSALVMIGGVALGYGGKRPTFKMLWNVLQETGKGMAPLMAICAAAGIVIGVLTLTGVSFSLTQLLIRLADGNVLSLLLMTAVICIILGMGLPTLGVYVLLAALVAPAMIQMGILDISAHLFVLYFGLMSMITPPICIAAFAAAGVAGAPPMKTGWAAMKFGWSAYIVPFIFVFSPALLMRGSWYVVVLTLLCVAIGIWAVSAALAGYLGGHLSMVRRGLLFVGGLAAMMPLDTHEYLLLAALCGTLVCVVIGAVSLRGGGRAARAT